MKDSTKKCEDTLQGFKGETYVMRLYVSGSTPASLQAIKNIKKICERELKNRCELEVIDVHEKPELAKKDNIIATPTLIRSLPQPLRKLIGDLSDTERVFVGLNLISKK